MLQSALWFALLFQLFRSDRPRASDRRRDRRTRLSLETLEDRTVPSTLWYVVGTGDTGGGMNDQGDLRYCMNNAQSGDRIQITVSGVIDLASPLPVISQTNLTISGSGQDPTINGYSANGSIFTIQRGASAEIDNVWIMNGHTAGNGGA